MKLYKTLLFGGILALATSCADNDALVYNVNQPDSLTNLEYLKSYDVLKSYVDRSINPNFKLGTGVSVSDFNSKGVVYRLVSSNFNEMTAGYEMKHGAIVQDDGTYNTSNVSSFLKNAEEAGVSVFGHTLCWHANQNATYLNDLIADSVVYTGGGSGGHSFFFKNPSAVNFWEAQVAYDLSDYLSNSTEYVLKFVAKASTNGTIRADVQTTTDYSSNSFGTFALTTDWKDYELTTTTSTATRKRFLFSYGDFAGTVYIDNITLTKKGSSTSVISGGDFENGSTGWGGWGNKSTSGLSADGEGYNSGKHVFKKTDEEKAQIIGSAMDRWISTMVDTCKHYVKAWDVVNEPMSDWPDPTQLKTGVGATLTADEFYWQDYLGKDYAVRAFRIARQHANSGDKLFINDYGLEGVDQKKCLGLIAYINYIESQGQKVDGIGTQMHVTLGETSIDGIRSMLTNLAATGKLIKISELDMGIRPEGSSANLTTSSITAAQLKQMSDFYQEIVKAYFELIPAAQRYGITQWAITDSPATSSWRPNEPIGLWSIGYNRKPAYAGFADGLKGE
ncbi:MAG: endo-1,4-beta-xylanase [Dysgonamonadaceae bacterium]